MNLLENKKVRMDYEILEEFEAGIELLGPEVKSIRAKHGKLEGSHIIMRRTGKGGRHEAYIVGMSIPPFQVANTGIDYDPARTRRLLLSKKELRELADFEDTKGLTIIPLSVYSKVSKLKIKIAVARGRKKYDKRAVLKERDSRREIQRTLKNQ